MRYTGGLLGGSWLTALAGDVGNGQFDGAWLVSNFESLDPANTLWKKPYNVYAKVDTEGPRFLEFEKWWGGHVVLNAEEMQFIVDKLFIGNKLSSSEIVTSDGARIDLRAHPLADRGLLLARATTSRRRSRRSDGSPISTRTSTTSARMARRSSTRCTPRSGIWASSSPPRSREKEHDEFAGNIDFIDVLPPGLYEAVLVPKKEVKETDLVSGDWMLRFEPRTFEELRSGSAIRSWGRPPSSRLWRGSRR